MTERDCNTSLLSRALFIEHVRAEMDLDERWDEGPATLDSLGHFELSVVLWELGAEIPAALLVDAATWDAVYDVYVDARVGAHLRDPVGEQ